MPPPSLRANQGQVTVEHSLNADSAAFLDTRSARGSNRRRECRPRRKPAAASTVHYVTTQPPTGLSIFIEISPAFRSMFMPREAAS